MSTGFLAIMGKIIIGLAVIAPVLALYFAMTSSDALGQIGVVRLLAGSGIFAIFSMDSKCDPLEEDTRCAALALEPIERTIFASFEDRSRELKSGRKKD